MYIIIEAGLIFEGTSKQFEDCFICEATEESIRDYCKNNLDDASCQIFDAKTWESRIFDYKGNTFNISSDGKDAVMIYDGWSKTFSFGSEVGPFTAEFIKNAKQEKLNKIAETMLEISKKKKMKNKDLHDKLDAFLEQRRLSSNGGWAEITSQDVTDLQHLISDVVKAKCEADADGDRPINFIVIDRTKFEPMHFFPVEYDNYKTEEEKQEIFNKHLSNLSIAMSRVDTAIRVSRFK